MQTYCDFILKEYYNSLTKILSSHLDGMKVTDQSNLNTFSFLLTEIKVKN